LRNLFNILIKRDTSWCMVYLCLAPVADAVYFATTPSPTPLAYKAHAIRRLELAHAVLAVFGNALLAPTLIPAAAAGSMSAIPLALATAVSIAALTVSTHLGEAPKSRHV